MKVTATSALLLLTISLAIHSLCVSAKSDVVVLDDRNFKKEVLQNPLPVLVEFYAPWCGHCKQLAPEWEKAATRLNNVVPVGKVDCTSNQNLCGKYGVKGYPTIKIFKDGKAQDYNSGRDAASISRAGFNSIPNSVSKLTTEAVLQNFKDTAPDSPHIILFTSKSSPNPLLKSLSLRHKKKLEIGYVQESATELINSFGITTFPTFIQLTEQGHEVLELKGAEAVIEKFTALAGEAPEKSTTETPQKKKATKKKASSEWVSVSEKSLPDVCTGLCIVAIVDEKANAADLAAVLAKFKNEKHVSFVTVDADSSAAIAAKFSVESPAFVLYKTKKKQFSAVPTFDSPLDFIESALDGNVKYTKLE
eukprot:TRINITY_DN122_c0_g1_i1.p1 TRINITY_DN122_c0_g1~~TRINITY_DN122_c0_g1_i1.p1  ORF type:complete len:388 (-),score=154.22 TRINITY_DN122_c0_g1_i1:120-1208(-)